MVAVRHLAGEIGPRPGTTPAYSEAADWVEGRLDELGWQAERQSFPAPAGFSAAGPTEGLPVEAGDSVNVIATRGDVVPGEPWLAVGAHLDTVPTSPGAEDNASGVGAVLAVAEAITGRRTRLPVVLIAFGAEEPRGPTDADHHYGSRAYVASLTPEQRRSLRGMVSLDRVGVGTVVPVGSWEAGDPLRAELLRAAGRVDVPTVAEAGQRSSDHWSFVREGLPGVRLEARPMPATTRPATCRPSSTPHSWPGWRGWSWSGCVERCDPRRRRSLRSRTRPGDPPQLQRRATRRVPDDRAGDRTDGHAPKIGVFEARLQPVVLSLPSARAVALEAEPDGVATS